MNDKQSNFLEWNQTFEWCSVELIVVQPRQVGSVPASFYQTEYSFFVNYIYTK